MQNITWSLVTVNYGNSEKILNLYKSLTKNPPSKDFELIVVDNASPGDDYEKLVNFFDQVGNVKVIKNTENLGFGKGNEEGVKVAEGFILGIINPDIEMKAGCLDRLLEVLENYEKVDIAVPQLLNITGEPQANARMFPSFLGLLAHRLFRIGKFTVEYLAVTEPEGQEVIPVEWAQGSFLVMRKSFFEQDLMGFDDRFFLFFEDMDLCRRCWELRKRVVKVKSAEAFHGSDRLSGGGFFTAIRKRTFWIHLQSALKYFWKYKFRGKPEVY